METNSSRLKYDAVFLLTALLVLFADQLSKSWIRANLQIGQVSLDLGFLRITNIHNTGAAFGIFQDQQFALTLIALIGIPAVIVAAIMARRFLPFLDNAPGMVALGLVLGGTAGNLTDRLRFGYVTDFIDFRVWPTFNVADASISIGIAVIALSIVLAARGEQQDG